MWVLILYYGVIAFVSSIFVFIAMANGDGFALLPWEIKELIDITWVGAIILFIISLILFPLVYLYLLLYFIFKGKLPEDY